MRGKEITVRKATSEDADAIISVLESTKLGNDTWKGNVTWVKEALQKSLSNANGTVFVAELDSAIIGFLDCIVFPSFWECAKQGMINHLFVHNAYHNKGIGSKLVKAITEWADAEGITEMHVSTERENVIARKIYGKYDFKQEHLLLERSQETQAMS